MPQISIITPFYIDITDKVIWFDEMLQSLLQQSFSDWETILIDDSSPVSIDELKYKYRDEQRFRWFKTGKRERPSAVRNTAITLAEAECLLPVDSDDRLAGNNVLRHMYQTYQDHQGQKIIFGNLKRMDLVNDYWQTGRTIQLPEYTFERAMDLDGIMPVTSMHSKDCHYAAGGWKSELVDGLEDVEYWIAAGKAGFCGQKLNRTTLVYRRHDYSRQYQLRQGMRENRTKILIREMHNDIYNGRFPMGCCGSGSTGPVTINFQVSNRSGLVTVLDNVPENEKVWVEYVGRQRGSFSIGGRRLTTEYRILGPGHKFEVHINDLQTFKSLGRGKDFIVGIPAPNQEPVREETPISNQDSVPALATIERLDSIAAKRQGVEIQESIPKEIVIEKVDIPLSLDEGIAKSYTTDLSPLNIPPKIQTILEGEGWTIEQLAEADTDSLLGYKGIGPKRSEQIVEAAKKWLVYGNG